MAATLTASPPARRALRADAAGLVLAPTADLIKLVSEGVSYGDVETLAAVSGFTLEQIAEAITVPRRTLTQRQKQGRLKPDESDRLIRLARLFTLAIGLFYGDAAGAGRWMTQPARALGGATPLAYSRTEPGAREVENVIGRIEHGVVL